MILRLISPSTCAKILMKFIRLLIWKDIPRRALQFSLELENRLYWLEGKLAVRYGNGIHPKHKHINYHRFFVKNLRPNERVLDIGSGNGLMSYEMANQVMGVQVVGVELNETNVKFAREHYRHPNLNFIHGDALKELPSGTFDVVTLSNVLEHIEHRVEFLKRIMRQVRPNRLIIRVPVFERDWRVPLKRELGINYRLDSTHYVEYLQEDYWGELRQAGLKIVNAEFRWGEIWSVVEPLSKVEINE